MRYFYIDGQLYRVDANGRLWGCLMKVSDSSESEWLFDSSLWVRDVRLYSSNFGDVRFPLYETLPLTVIRVEMNGVSVEVTVVPSQEGRTFKQFQQLPQVDYRSRQYTQGLTLYGSRTPVWGNPQTMNEPYLASQVIISPVTTPGSGGCRIRVGVWYDDVRPTQHPDTCCGMGMLTRDGSMRQWKRIACGYSYWSGHMGRYAGSIWGLVKEKHFIMGNEKII